MVTCPCEKRMDISESKRGPSRTAAEQVGPQWRSHNHSVLKLIENSASLAPTCCKEPGVLGAVPQSGPRYGGHEYEPDREGGTDDGAVAQMSPAKRLSGTLWGHRKWPPYRRMPH